MVRLVISVSGFIHHMYTAKARTYVFKTCVLFFIVVTGDFGRVTVIVAAQNNDVGFFKPT